MFELLPKSPQRIDRFMPGSASISSYHIKSPEGSTLRAQRAAQKSRSVSGVNPNVLFNDTASVTTLPSQVAPPQFEQYYVPAYLPPSLGAMGRVSQNHNPHDHFWTRGLAGPSNTQTDAEEVKGEAMENHDEYNSRVAGALGVSNSRVFMYNTTPDKKREFRRMYAGSDVENMAINDMPVKKVCKKKVLSHIPYRILDAPGLRNDFYSNLVAWSKKSGQIAVGLLEEVFIWTEHEGAAQIPIPPNYKEVTCLVFSCENVLAIGHKDGTVVFFDVNRKRIVATYVHVEAPACFLAWFPDDPSQILLGDENGGVYQLYIKWGLRSSTTCINKRSVLKAHTQQICGMY